ncbi:MAG: hypothetical protein AAB074_21840 [Planctomycetota bacterium]
MRRPLLISVAVLALAGLGIGGYFAFRAEDEGETVKAHPKLMQELAAKRDHVTLVISGRLMAEIFPCG